MGKINERIDTILSLELQFKICSKAVDRHTMIRARNKSVKINYLQFILMLEATMRDTWNGHGHGIRAQNIKISITINNFPQYNYN